MQSYAKQQWATPSPKPLETYAQARTNIRRLLMITEEDSKEHTLPEDDRSKWLYEPDSKDVKVEAEGEEENGEEGCIKPRKLRKVNELNQQAIITINEPVPKHEEQPSTEQQEQPPTEEEVSKSIIDGLVSQAAQSTQSIRCQTNLDVSDVTRFSPQNTPDWLRGCNNLHVSEQLPEWLDDQQLLTHVKLLPPAEEKPQEGSEENPNHAKLESGGRETKKESRARGKMEGKVVIEVDDDSSPCKQQRPAPQRLATRLISSPAAPFFSHSRDLMLMQERSSWIRHQRRMRARVRHTQKEFERTLWIAGKRLLHEKNGSANYEYLWTFGDVSCWKTLVEHESLLKLYLCQAKIQNAPILKLLPDTLESDISFLICKIEVCPNYRLEEQEVEVERTLFSHFLFVEVSKYFQQAMLLKAFSFNRRVITAPTQQTTQLERNGKKGTVFIDLEVGEQASQTARTTTHQSDSSPSCVRKASS